MLTVVGGTYAEHCLEPFWDELYGSGGRAAVALGRHVAGLRLFTRIGQREQAVLQNMAKASGFVAEPIVADETGYFRYHHPLSTPSFSSGLVGPNSLRTVEVADDVVLCFGMIDAKPVVKGRRVIYDPQSPGAPADFSSFGSEAEHLAIVLNRSEAIKLGGGSSLEGAAANLLGRGAEVVVVKSGSEGAFVFTASGSSRVPAFWTPTVFSIGSGDVFAAFFALYWGVKEADAHFSACCASRAAALYCDRQTPTFLLEEVEADSFYPEAPRPRSVKPVYLAGPFFDMPQRWLVTEVRKQLWKQGLKVFSPFHDVGHGLAKDVVPADLEAINNCSCLYAICDGLDSGTLFEAGYARAKGLPVVAFAQRESEEGLKMLRGSGCRICSDFVSSIYSVAWEAWAS